MARVPYVDPSDSPADSELAELFAAISRRSSKSKEGAQSVELRGSVTNLWRALANNPAALGAFLAISNYVRDGSSLNPRLRELVVLTSAYANNVRYVIHAHVRAARRVGVSEAQVAAFPDWAASHCFNPLERAVLSYADQVTRRLRVDDECFDELRRHLSLPEIVDLVVLVGHYQLVSAVIVPLQIEPDS